MGAKIAGGELIQILCAACVALRNGWTLRQCQPQQGKGLCVFYEMLCYTALCREAVRGGEGESGGGRADVCIGNETN